jgi:hypothetical protein
MLIDPLIPAERETVLHFAADPKTPDIRIPDLWDGAAGERILSALLSHA